MGNLKNPPIWIGKLTFHPPPFLGLQKPLIFQGVDWIVSPGSPLGGSSQLGYVVNNHGDRVRPLIGGRDPFQMA